MFSAWLGRPPANQDLLIAAGIVYITLRNAADYSSARAANRAIAYLQRIVGWT